jgi:hypothetical protein
VKKTWMPTQAFAWAASSSGLHAAAGGEIKVG